MIHSFFPNPKLLFSSLIGWIIVCIAVWYTVGPQMGAALGLPPLAEGVAPPDGLSYFVTTESIWFYCYFFLSMVLFCGAWEWLAKDHVWRHWSLWGSASILFFAYFSVDVSVAINNWRGPTYDLIQQALATPGKPTVAVGDLYARGYIFLSIASVYMFLAVISDFATSHFLFRWRTAMNDFYMSKWNQLRRIEGASQRIQEDTMRFVRTMEGLASNLIGSVMTLIAFLPVLAGFSKYVKELPIIGEIPYALVFAAVFWSLFGTFLMIVVGVKLPGLEFRNQRVEAAYRKELVYGEDSAERAQPLTVKELFDNVRKNYFRLYWNYAYFNIFRQLYLQADNVFSLIILMPTIAAAAITFGLFQQIRSAFIEVATSFQYLINAWPTIIELLSIRKRLVAFESAIEGEPLPTIDQEYLAKLGTGNPEE